MNNSDKEFSNHLQEMVRGEAQPDSLAGWFALIPHLAQMADGDANDRRLLKDFAEVLEGGVRKQICLEIGLICVFGLRFGREEFGMDAETVMLDFEFSSLGKNHLLTLSLKSEEGVGLFWSSVGVFRNNKKYLKEVSSFLVGSDTSDEYCQQYGKGAAVWLSEEAKKALPAHTPRTLMIRKFRNAENF